MTAAARGSAHGVAHLTLVERCGITDAALVF